jgi:hypothetical protein
MKYYLAFLACTLIVVACGNRTSTSGGQTASKSQMEIAVLDPTEQVQSLRSNGTEVLFGTELRESTLATSTGQNSHTQLQFWIVESGQPIAQVQLELPKRGISQFLRVKETCSVSGKPEAEFCKLKSAFIKKLTQDRLGNTRVLYHYLSENFATTPEEKSKAIAGCTLELQHQNLEWQQALSNSPTPELYRYTIFRSDRSSISGPAQAQLRASLSCYKEIKESEQSVKRISVFRGSFQFGQ